MAVKRFKRHEEHENHERWLVSYADFITLLFAFFVVMYATSSKNEEKEKSFENSVKASLKIAVVGAGGGGGGGNSILERWVPELSRSRSGGAEEASEDEFPQKGSPAEVQDFIQRQLNKKMSAEKREKDLGPLRHDAKGVRVTLAASSFFPSGSYKIKRSSLETLNELAELLKKTDRHIIIEGHTDNTPIGSAGSEVAAGEDSNDVIGGGSGNPVVSNWELASLRATSVVRYLVQVQKIDPARLAAISYADQKPIDTNTTAEGRAHNRRIEILIEGD